jgi:hypothetical protein
MPKFKRLVLTELGNTTDTFQWKELERGTKYRFETGEYGYIVKIERHKPEEMYIGYMIDPSDFDWSSGGTPFNSVTNEGEVFKIVSTVVEIVKRAWKNRFDLYENPEQIEYISFDGSPKDDEVYSNRTQRDKLYLRFIQSQFPNADLRETSGGYRIYPIK